MSKPAASFPTRRFIHAVLFKLLRHSNSKQLSFIQQLKIYNMKFIKWGSLMAIALILLLQTACKKTTTDPIPTPAAPGQFTLEFEHKWGMMLTPFSLNTLQVHPMTGDSLTFTTFRYYVSNIKVKKDDGTWWSEPNSYHIVDLTNTASLEIELDDVPAGNYTELQYTMGVDSLRNLSGAQDGALSVTEGMFWNWNSGYIMLKAEGTSPDAANNTYLFHLGGFSGSNNIVTVKTTNFNGSTMSIASDKTPHVHLVANPARLWHSSPSVSTKNTIHMPGAEAKTMALDFYNNISFDELHQ
jgi:hypothetical protein